MPWRNLFRQTRRTTSTVFGVVAGFTLLLLARSLSDTLSTTMDELIASGFQEDLRVEMLHPVPASVVQRVRGWPGVKWAEGELGVPVEFRKGGRRYTALMLGRPDLHLLRPVERDPADSPSANGSGALFGPTLRRRLDLERGDTVEVAWNGEDRSGAPSWRTVRVMGFTREPIGTVAYLPSDDLRRLFRHEVDLPPHAISSVRVTVDPPAERYVRGRLLDLPEAVAVTSSGELRRMVQELTRSFESFVGVLQLFGMALAFCILFNTVTVCVLERAREVATMRALGFSRGQVAALVVEETGVIVLGGIVLGLPIGTWFVNAVFRAAQTPEQMDLFVMEAVVLPASYVASAALTVAAAAIALVPALRSVGRLDLARALKLPSG